MDNFHRTCDPESDFEKGDRTFIFRVSKTRKGSAPNYLEVLIKENKEKTRSCHAAVSSCLSVRKEYLVNLRDAFEGAEKCPSKYFGLGFCNFWQKRKDPLR